MLILISFFIFVLLVILLILLFCSKKKRNKNNFTHNQKIHFKFSISKNTYAEFDYEINNNKNQN